MFETTIARRYLWMVRKRAHAAFLTTISLAGIAVGVATLLISLALLSGFQSQIKQRLIAASPQILIEPRGKNTIDDAPAIVAAARRLGMRDIEPIIDGISWGGNEEEHRGRPMRIRSYEPGQEPALEPRTRPWTPAAGEPTISVTRGFGATIGLNLGDQVTVVVPRTKLTPFGPVPVWRKYRIVRLVVARENNEHAADGFLPSAEASSLFGTGGKPTSIEMFGDAENAESVQSRLAERFPGVQVKTWKEINRPLFLALRLEKIVMFATISLIIFVAALNLISSMSMLILEKRPAVGVLRTLGATERNILSIFLQVGVLIGLIGTLLGNIFGLGLAWTLNRYHLVPLPSQMYFMAYLPFDIDLGDVIGVNVIAVCLSVIATWYPARIAARLDPIVAIREE